MTTIQWNGLEIEGSVSHDPGVHTFRNGDPGYPPSTDVEITSISIDDPKEFVQFCKEFDIPTIKWKDAILEKWSDEISDKLVDRWSSDRGGF